jgi:hypothetical protein
MPPKKKITNTTDFKSPSMYSPSKTSPSPSPSKTPSSSRDYPKKDTYVYSYESTFASKDGKVIEDSAKETKIKDNKITVKKFKNNKEIYSKTQTIDNYLSNSPSPSPSENTKMFIPNYTVPSMLAESNNMYDNQDDYDFLPISNQSMMIPPSQLFQSPEVDMKAYILPLSRMLQKLPELEKSLMQLPAPSQLPSPSQFDIQLNSPSPSPAKEIKKKVISKKSPSKKTTKK